MFGKNDFPIVLDIAAIKAITDLSKQPRLEDAALIPDYNDLQTLIVIRALERFMTDRHVDPGFRIEITYE